MADNPRAAALRLLSRRDLTTAELTAKLLDRGFESADVTRVVKGFVADGTIDNRRTALAYVRTASQVKARGRRRIRLELQLRGLAPDVIDEVLAEALPIDEDFETIRRFLARRGGSARRSLADRQRLFQQLLRRGFAPDAIAKALRTQRPDEDE